MTQKLWQALNERTLSPMEVLIGAMIGALIMSWVLR